MPPVAYPATDTFRGGLELAVAVPGSDLLDTSLDQDLLGTALPGGWGSATAGSGTVTPTTLGVKLSTGGNPGSTASLQTPAVTAFDASFEIVYIGSPAVSQERAPIAQMVCDVGGEELSIIIWLETTGRWTLVGSTTSRPGGSQIMLPARPLVLQIVREGVRAWLFYGTRATDGVHIEGAVALARITQYVAGAGTLTVSCANLTNAVDLAVYVRNFVVRSHARIGPRLILDKTAGDLRITGVVPAATVQEVGDNELGVFGIFGSTSAATGFAYSLPQGRTVAEDATKTLISYQDEQVRDES